MCARIVDFRGTESITRICHLSYVLYVFSTLLNWKTNFKILSLVGDIKSELSDTVRNTRQNHPSQSSQMGILQVLRANNIDYSKYKLTKSADEILTDLDWRTADLVKQADLTKHQTQMVSATKQPTTTTPQRLS